MFMFVLIILCHNLLGTNWSKVGTKRLSLGTNRLAEKDRWVRNDWIPTWIRLFALHEAKQERI